MFRVVVRGTDRIAFGMCKLAFDGASRQAEAERVIRIASPLNFSLECVRWIRHYESRPEENRVLPAEGETSVQNILIERIEEESEHLPLYRSYPKDASNLYFTWAHPTNAGHVRAILEARFNSEPAEVDTFLSCYVGEAWELESGLPRPSDFQRREYDNVSHVIPAEYIAANLRQRYGAELDNPQNYPDDRMPQPRRVAHQFMNVHQHVLRAANVEQQAVGQEAGPENPQ